LSSFEATASHRLSFEIDMQSFPTLPFLKLIFHERDEENMKKVIQIRE
jgi:hypothetical protein